MSEVGAVTRVEIALSWKPTLFEEKHFNWHRDPLYTSHTMRVGGPRVYRWFMRQKNGEVESVYIGESGDFYERLLDYRLRVQRQDDRDDLVNAMRDCENCGGAVELQFLDLDEGSFDLNGKLVNGETLRYHETRLMMESIAIFMAKASNLKVLNELREDAYLTAILKIVKGDIPAAIKLLERCQRNILEGYQGLAEKG